jgi:hypothetical protein
MIHDRGQQFGPHTEAELAQLVGVGTISEQALAWRTGSPRWVGISSVVPMPIHPKIQNMPAYAPHSPPALAAARLRSGIKTSLLVSAVANIVIGLAWLAVCIGVVFIVPMVVLCIFEFLLYAKVDELPDAQLSSRARVLGVFEIIVGLVNTVTLVCGILVLINSNKLGGSAHVA